MDRLEELPVVRECYDQWCSLQSEVESYYHDKPREKKKLSQEKEFRQIKNAVIQEAERVRLGEITFEDADLSDHDEPEQVRGESYACWELRQIIRDDTLPLADRDDAVAELEQLAGARRRPRPVPDGAALSGRPSADPGQPKGESTGSPRRQSRVCRRHSTPLASCFSLTIGRCGTRTRASAG